ncbi:hypothetical protein JCM30394_18120 [Deferrisoma palaeochoriense]
MLAGLAGEGWAARCGTGVRDRGPQVRFAPLPRRAALREVAPVDTAGAHVLTTEHFRVLWGDGYDASDTDWGDSNGDGKPDWVGEWADALEDAYDTLVGLGFPAPYGSDRYYIDVYVGNTGVVVEGTPVLLDSSYYAYTEIDTDFGVAYMVVNDDFSAHTHDEAAVLRATAAHELFHAVQRSLGYPWDDEAAVPDSRWRKEGWWFEATATWMEEVVTPDVDDYVTYVKEFLSHPEEPLNSQDGLREYGAAIFPGFLWLRHGADLWVDVFSRAYEEGLEAVLDEALEAQAGTTLADTVAAFWSLAAHPEDFWPDGAEYRSTGVPRLSRDAAVLPLDYSTGFSSAPGRFGANLFRLPVTGTSLTVLFQPTSPGQARLAVSREGDPSAAVTDLSEGTRSVSVPGGDGPAYVALVNLGEAGLNYSVAFEEGGQGTVSDATGTGSGGNQASGTGEGTAGTGPGAVADGASPTTGGCFLSSLAW